MAEYSMTGCPQGHPYDEVNTGRTKKGHRYCRTCIRERSKKWYAEHREYSRLRSRERMRKLRSAGYKDDPEKHRIASARYLQTAKGRQNHADKQERRRALKKRVPTEFVRRQEVLRRGDGLCGICGDAVDPDNFHVDHIVPLARGGSHTYANTQPSHPSCNVRKGAGLL